MGRFPLLDYLVACHPTRPESSRQATYSLAGRDQRWELMPLALDQSVGTLTWSPLVWGRLTGRIRHGQPVPEASRRHSLAQADVAPPRPRSGGRCTFFLTRPDGKRPDRSGDCDAIGRRIEARAARPSRVASLHRFLRSDLPSTVPRIHPQSASKDTSQLPAPADILRQNMASEARDSPASPALAAQVGRTRCLLQVQRPRHGRALQLSGPRRRRLWFLPHGRGYSRLGRSFAHPKWAHI
jgi:hypothetical protein